MSNKTDKVYEVRTGPGESLGLQYAVAHCDSPTFCLEDVSGNKIHWCEHLCKEATPEQTIEYWKARAHEAERKTPRHLVTGLSEMGRGLLNQTPLRTPTL